MAASKSTNTYNRQNWEDSDFPILCQTCLGDNPYMRMTKDRYGTECKICSRPFTVFRWCPGARMRFKKTEVCQVCCKLKNCCQTCLLDLEYGLPLQVRDQALSIKDEIPRSNVNKEYYTQNMEKQMANSDNSEALGAVGKVQAPSDLLMKLARTAPYYKRNRPHICSFWVKGECKRGEECPYRHEKPTDPDDPLSDQNIRDRYYGVNDPVASKLMQRATSMPALEPPEDRAITTLYVGGLSQDITDQDLRDHFYAYGEIRSINLVAKQQCAFVTYTTRSAAEQAAEKLFNKVILKGRRLNIKWGRSQGQAPGPGEGKEAPSLQPVPGLPGVLPAPPTDPATASSAGATNFFNLPPPMLPPAPGTGPAPPGAYGIPPPGFRPTGPPPPLVAPPPPPRPGPGPPPPQALRPPPVHYPSQDPQRMGAGKHAT